jgi:hypothetical protein
VKTIGYFCSETSNKDTARPICQIFVVLISQGISTNRNLLGFDPGSVQEICTDRYHSSFIIPSRPPAYELRRSIKHLMQLVFLVLSAHPESRRSSEEQTKGYQIAEAL